MNKLLHLPASTRFPRVEELAFPPVILDNFTYERTAKPSAPALPLAIPPALPLSQHGPRWHSWSSLAFQQKPRSCGFRMLCLTSPPMACR